MSEEQLSLSPLVGGHVARLFPIEQQDDVARALIEECGSGRLYKKMDWTALTERVQCAVLRMSEGRLDKLAEAINLYHSDWSSLLKIAGFSSDIHAHESWTGEEPPIPVESPAGPAQVG